ncbi:MAG: flagellar hook basal-body protein [Planctomycetes bacterium]|nr:flagellar hook basal-body protein [Planctomycetota bacterium]
MDKGLYMSVAAMRSAEKRIETIAGNLANVSSPSFKRSSSVTQAFDVGAGTNKHTELRSTTSVDWTQGMLERREDPFALALEGDGFFAVETPEGEAYTRDGAFRLNDLGELLTKDGYPVSWVAARGRVQATGEEVTVDGAGKVRQGKDDIGQLKLADFADRSQLKVDRFGYWHARPDMEPKEPTAVVRQNSYERSNAEAIDELVGLIKVQRSFESAANVMKSIDQSYKRLNNAR